MLNVSQTLRQFWFSVSVFVPATFLASSEGDGGGKDALCQKHLRDVERLLWFYLVLLNKNFQFFTFVFFFLYHMNLTSLVDLTALFESCVQWWGLRSYLWPWWVQVQSPWIRWASVWAGCWTTGSSAGPGEENNPYWAAGRKEADVFIYSNVFFILLLPSW